MSSRMSPFISHYAVLDQKGKMTAGEDRGKVKTLKKSLLRADKGRQSGGGESQSREQSESAAFNSSASASVRAAPIQPSSCTSGVTHRGTQGPKTPSRATGLNPARQNHLGSCKENYWCPGPIPGVFYSIEVPFIYSRNPKRLGCARDYSRP